MAGRYDDIIDLERPVSKTHAPMPMSERAAQFSPFAALTGYEEIIAEAGRLTARRIELDEDAKQELNRSLLRLSARLEAGEGPLAVELTWFEPDGLKLGGEYLTRVISLRRVDRSQRLLELEDRSVIEIDRLLSLRENPEEG